MFWKNVPTEGERFRQELYHKWEIQWGIDISTCEQDSEAERLFMDFFKTIYHETEAKSEKNRRMNFVFKGLFILCLFLISASLVVVPCLAIAGKFAIPISNATEEHTVTIADLTFLNAQIFLAGGTLLFAINKIINVKKYQKTWVRHSSALYKYQLAMFYYLLGSIPAKNFSSDGIQTPNPDNSPESLRLRNAFKERVFEILGGNLQKVSYNLEKREKDLMEDLREFLQR